jgi:hypothetical protein
MNALRGVRRGIVGDGLNQSEPQGFCGVNLFGSSKYF